MFVVLIGTVYGLNAGVLSAVLASVSLTAGYLRQSTTLMLLFYEPANWLAFIIYFVVGASCGYVQLRNTETARFVQEENELLHKRLNLPAKDKMSKPSYNSIKNEDIKEIEIEGGKIRLLARKYGEHEGYKGDYLSMDYYDIHLNADAEVTLTMEEDDSVMVFTLLGDVYIDGEHIEEKTAVKLTEGDSLTIKNGNEKAQVLYMNSRALNEPVAWAGPIVMNTQEELQKAFLELRSNTFIKETAEY